MKIQKPSRFAAFANPFKKRPKSTTSSASSQSLDKITSPKNDGKIPAGRNVAKTNQDKTQDRKQLSLESAQQRLINENRRSPRQRTPLPLENEKAKDDEKQDDKGYLKTSENNARMPSPLQSPKLNNITTIESLRFVSYSPINN